MSTQQDTESSSSYIEELGNIARLQTNTNRYVYLRKAMLDKIIHRIRGTK